MVDGALWFRDKYAMKLVISSEVAGPNLDGEWPDALNCSKLLFPTSNIWSVLGAHALCISLSLSCFRAAIGNAESLLAVCRLLGHLTGRSVY